MRIATLQFAPKVGDVEGNLARANEVLRNAEIRSPAGVVSKVDEGLGLDLLVLPELALTGYNFPSLRAIRPYLEVAGQGPSATWAKETARRLGCKVCVGYPELAIEDDDGSSGGETEKCYNSLLVVDELGNVILNYRKAFLYYTDETWASEGIPEHGFQELIFRKNKKTNNRRDDSLPGETAVSIATSFGICMDINPYKFEAPFSAWEFANRVLDSKSQLVVLSMAWLTLLSRDELDLLAHKPELDTFNYWVQRFLPLVRTKMKHDVNGDGDEGASDSESAKQIIIVFANRAGEEEGSTLARYAGTSAIIAVTQRPRRGVHERGEGRIQGDLSTNDKVAQGEDPPSSVHPPNPFDVRILCWDMMGATTEGVCYADTTADPTMVFQLVKASES